MAATEAAIGWVEERFGASSFARKALKKVFPDHWSFLLGEIALFTFVVILATGVYLTLFYEPSATETVYHGPYGPLEGQSVTNAYNSTMHLSLQVRSGLLIRQMHHWAALVFIASIVVHMCRIFFTGAFRKPRELNWVIGFTLLMIALAEGFSGYSLPDDLLSGIGLRIAYSVMLSIPLVGTWLAYLLFGGEFPNPQFIPRLFVAHVMILPAILIGLISVHLFILVLQKHTQFRSPGHTERNVVGKNFWPEQTFKSTGLLLLVGAMIALLAGLFQINPIWEYGPYRAWTASSPAQPDWYIGWLDGSLRLSGPWSITLFGHTLGELFWPSVAFPGLVFTAIGAWPFLEQRFTKDRAIHNLLDRPRDAPVRTAFGVAALVNLGVLFAEGGNDVMGQLFNVPVESITRILQVSFVVLPIVAFYVTYKICKNLKAAGLHPAFFGAGERLRRTAAGAYETIPADYIPQPNGASGDGAGTGGATSVGGAIPEPEPVGAHRADMSGTLHPDK